MALPQDPPPAPPGVAEITFATDEDVLMPDDKAKLDESAKYLQDNPTAAATDRL